MKKLLIAFAVLTLIAGFSTSSFAAIDGSAHDLGDDSLGTTEICVFCPVPHNPLKHLRPDYPLWNHADTSQTFTLYNGSTTTASGNSQLCLSCHDGVTNLDAFGGSAGSTDMGTAFPSSAAIVGTDLSDDHPVMVTYPGPNADYNDPSGFSYAAVFSGNIECGSCHDPHDTTNTPFLRASNTNSQLCLDCHIK